jgi:hypothetical protein
MMIELNKMTLAEIVQDNGGSITAEDLTAKLIAKGADKQSAADAVAEFTHCRLVTFDGTTISFQ